MQYKNYISDVLKKSIIAIVDSQEGILITLTILVWDATHLT